MQVPSILILLYTLILSMDCIAQSKIDSLEETIEHSDNIHQKADCYIKILESIDWQKPDSTFLFLERFKDLKEIDEYPQYFLQLKYYYSRAHRAKGDYFYAITYAKESFDISQSISDTLHAARAAYQYGTMNLFIGNMTESLDYLSLSYDYYSILNMENNVADLNNALAGYFIDNNNIEKGLEKYMEALDVYERINDSTGMSNVHANLGLAYIDNEEYEKAEFHLSEQGRIDSLLQTQYGLGFYLDFMGYLRQSEGKYSEAISWFEKAIETRKNLSSHYNLCESNIGMGYAQYEIANYSNAIMYAKEIFKFKEVHQSLSQESSAHEILYKCYEKLGNHKLALHHHKEYKKIGDSIYNKNKVEALAEGEAKLKKADLDREIAVLNKEKQLNELKLKEQNLIITASIIGILSLGLLSFFIARLYRNIKEKNSQIQSTLKDKDILLREIHHRVKNNLQVISSLLSLQSRQISDVHVQQAINEGRNRVRSMALIHQNLYQNENLTGVDVHQYLDKLVMELFNTYNIKQQDISLDLDVDNLNLDVDTMIPLGLVINELVSNCLKHAFDKNDNGKINISLQEKEQKLILKVSDNGKGIEENIFENSKSFGNRLIKAFSQKLKADFSIKSDQGTHITMVINNYLKAA